jgi:hypothetical protein
MFDYNSKQLTFESPFSKVHVTVRYPTDAEWIGRSKQVSLRNKKLSRTETEVIVEGAEKADAALFDAIRIDNGDPLQDGEATFILRHLEEASIVGDPEPDGASQWAIELDTPQGNTSFVLRTPSAREYLDYKPSSIVEVSGGTAFRTNLKNIGDIYKRLVVNVAGYAAAVPIPHQEPVVKALMERVGRSTGLRPVLASEQPGAGSSPSAG